MNYPEALAWLYGLQRFGIKLGLENIQRLIAELQIDFGSARVIHVAGTNGKGSVCAMIDSICRAASYRTGLFISPHLVTFRERIQIDGEMISADKTATGLTVLRQLVATWDPHPTFFEITTALALKHFSDAKLDVVILETGLGGRLDATNAVQSNVSVITPIDFDHEKWLGDSLEKIAAEKAGIIKPKVPVISAPQFPEAENVIRARAAECEAPLQFVTSSHNESPVALQGAHQKLNAAIALAIVGVLSKLDGFKPSSFHRSKIDGGETAIIRGLADVQWPARFQKWDEQLIIDGAHNPAAARVLAQTWSETFGGQRATLVLAILSDKDIRAICEPLVPIAHSILLPKIRSERAAAPDKIAKIISSIAPVIPRSATASIADALQLARAKPNPILLTGSLHFAGEALALLRGEPAAFEECAQ